MSDSPIVTPTSLALHQQTNAHVVIHFLNAYSRWREKFNSFDFNRPIEALMIDQAFQSQMNFFWNLQLDQYLFYSDGALDKAWLSRWFVSRRYDWHFAPMRLNKLLVDIEGSPALQTIVRQGFLIYDNELNPFEHFNSLVKKYTKASYELDHDGTSLSKREAQDSTAGEIIELCIDIQNRCQIFEIDGGLFNGLSETTREVRKCFIRTQLWRHSWRDFKAERTLHLDEPFRDFAQRLEYAMMSSKAHPIRDSLTADFSVKAVTDH